ncbi:MAG: aminoacyl-tRNA hydrolase [Calditrichaeota bacterium]|nr:MAG: aminoacyl-tRNA hydrolase [Calditrichota bacterium]MBL1207492.1 aminoacyl-tRNA hydrolase [Calditrichota bacterium]NOG47324.1 aminoacyl-tRNA hydrolase [Calditrichota bacterium]
MIQIKNDVYLDENKLSFQAVRSSGPGGQHVNKVSSKVILSCPLAIIRGLSERQLEMIITGLSNHLVNGNVIKIESQKHRSQFANKQDAVEKLILHLQRALKEKKPRKKTKTPKSVKEKRLQQKKKRAQLKQTRKTIDD